MLSKRVNLATPRTAWRLGFRRLGSGRFSIGRVQRLLPNFDLRSSLLKSPSTRVNFLQSRDRPCQIRRRLFQTKGQNPLAPLINRLTCLPPERTRLGYLKSQHNRPLQSVRSSRSGGLTGALQTLLALKLSLPSPNVRLSFLIKHPSRSNPAGHLNCPRQLAARGYLLSCIQKRLVNKPLSPLDPSLNFGLC